MLPLLRWLLLADLPLPVRDGALALAHAIEHNALASLELLLCSGGGIEEETEPYLALEAACAQRGINFNHDGFA